MQWYCVDQNGQMLKDQEDTPMADIVSLYPRYKTFITFVNMLYEAIEIKDVSHEKI